MTQETKYIDNIRQLEKCLVVIKELTKELDNIPKIEIHDTICEIESGIEHLTRTLEDPYDREY